MLKGEFRNDFRNISFETSDAIVIHDWSEPRRFYYYRHFLEKLKDSDKKMAMKLLYELMQRSKQSEEWEGKTIQSAKLTILKNDSDKFMRIIVTYCDGKLDKYNEKKWYICPFCGVATRICKESIEKDEISHGYLYKCPKCANKGEISPKSLSLFERIK